METILKKDLGGRKHGEDGAEVVGEKEVEVMDYREDGTLKIDMSRGGAGLSSYCDRDAVARFEKASIERASRLGVESTSNISMSNSFPICGSS